MPKAFPWSPLPHLPQPSCQPCFPPCGHQLGEVSSQGTGGDGALPRLQILQGRVQPCPPKPDPSGVPALFTPLGPGQAGAALGEWGCWCVGKPFLEGLRPSLQHCSCPEHLQGVPAVRPFPIPTLSPISNHSACLFQFGLCRGIPGSWHHCRAGAGKGAVQGRHPGTAPPLSPPATPCQLKVTAPRALSCPATPAAEIGFYFP